MTTLPGATNRLDLITERLRDSLLTLSDEARQARRVHATSEVILRPLIDRLPCAAFVANRYGQYVLVNRAACELTGYEERELRHLSVWDLTPQSMEHEAERLWQTFLDRHEQNGEYQLRVKSGRVMQMVYAAQSDVLPGLHVSLIAERSGLYTERRPRATSRATHVTAQPEGVPSLVCPTCDRRLEYQHTRTGGVRPMERWHYLRCQTCGLFVYRDRTRKLSPLTK